MKSKMIWRRPRWRPALACMGDGAAAAPQGNPQGRPAADHFSRGQPAPPSGAPPNYMTGWGQIYGQAACVPCLPVALNSGLFWPRRTFIALIPARWVVEFLDPLARGPAVRKDFHRAESGCRSKTPPTGWSKPPRAEQAELFWGVCRAAPGRRGRGSG